jgi:predicted kinase
MKSFLEIVEEKDTGKHAVMTYGRMNPPTTGHLKVIDKVKEIAKDVGGSHHVIVSHTQDVKKNPLSGEQKIKHLKRYSPDTNIEASNKEHPSIFHHAEKLHNQGVTHLHVVVGSDRVKEFKDSLNKYNGKPNKEGKVPYHFKKITVHSAGQRDPDTEDKDKKEKDSVSSMSATKMRDAASEKRFHDVKNSKGEVVKTGFRSGVPAHVSDTHAKELMNDTRKGMGIHESYNHGQFKAIFVTGGPGSGKDIIIREAIAESKIVELNFIQAQEYLADKQKLSERTSDFRREGIRNRGPLIINGPADDKDRIAYIKEELEELGYDTMMIFVETTNETSKERNSLLSRMVVESVRQDKWLKSQQNTKYFQESFTDCITFDNTGNLDTKEEDIHFVYEKTNVFLDSGTLGETAEDWLNRRSKLNINSLFKENKNVKSNFRPIQENAPGQQLQRKIGKVDSVTDGDVKYTSGYDPRGYTEDSGESTGQKGGPKIQVLPQTKEPSFQKDKEKVKAQKNKTFNVVMSRSVNQGTGIGDTYNSRVPGVSSGLGNQTYSEQKSFGSFRKVKEAIDDPGACDMGVGGVLGGSTNKEPLVTPDDVKIKTSADIKKKKKNGD